MAPTYPKAAKYPSDITLWIAYSVGEYKSKQCQVIIQVSQVTRQSEII